MKKIFISLMQLHTEVAAFLTRNSAKFAGNVPVIDATASLQARIAVEQAQARETTKIIKGYAGSKKTARIKMAGLCDAMRKRVQSWAIANNDTVVFQNAGVTYSEVAYGAVLTGITRAQNIHDLANAMPVADNATYMVTTSDLTQFQAQIDLVTTLNTQRRSSVVLRQTAGELLTATIKDTSKFIHDTLDSLMGNYRVKDMPLYTEYINCRSVIDSASRHASISGTVKIEGTNTPLPRVKVIASNGIKIFEDFTDIKGNYKMPVSPELYNITFEILSYVPKSVSDVLVDSAERQQVNVTLVKS